MTNRVLFLSALGLPASLLAGGCKQCDTPISPPSLLEFPFSADTLGTGTGFTRAEALSTYLVSYTDNYFRQPIDTVRANQRTGYLKFVRGGLCQLSPPTASTVPLSYRLNVPKAQRQFTLNGLEAKYDSNVCTSRVTQVTAFLNGKRVDITQPYQLTK